MSSGIWKCPRGPIDVQKRVFVSDPNPSKQLYASSIYHRRQRTFQVQSKLKENTRRLIDTIPMYKDALLDSTLIKTQLEKRQALLEHCYQMVKYIDYLHRICEFVAVAAAGYTNHPKEFFNSFPRFELVGELRFVSPFRTPCIFHYEHPVFSLRTPCLFSSVRSS
jgi:hypothetical protein